MRNWLPRTLFHGRLKVLIALLALLSILFITYQIFYYMSLTAFQVEESISHFQQHKRQTLEKFESSTQKSSIPGVKHDRLLQVTTEILPAHGKPITRFVIGVAPEYRKYYSKLTPMFYCLSHKSRKISWDKVNDDYCDCPIDGSDEPSTAACMNGKFYCTKSTKNYPEYIPSSRVNDGICDCCDGSDEYLKYIMCKNACK